MLFGALILPYSMYFWELVMYFLELVMYFLEFEYVKIELHTFLLKFI